MSTEAPTSPRQQDVITVRAEQLPVRCPGPDAPLWSLHPRVYLELDANGRACCPYCGTTYQLVGPAPAGH